MKQIYFSVRKRIRRFACDEEGSAVLEFVALALPLFIPLFIFLNQYASSSDAQSSLRTLGREMARGFVTSENDQVAESVAQEIFEKGSQVLGFESEVDSGSLNYEINCKNHPCITPNNEVVIILKSRKSATEISTVEYVSPWS